MIEIQLSIKNESSFLNYSDQYSHFIYELTRAPMGPISELMNVWNNYSPRSEYFKSKFNKFNRYTPGIRKARIYKYRKNVCKEHNLKQNMDSKYYFKSMKLPFWCELCGIFCYKL